MSVNSIGTFHFVSLSRPPELLQQQVVTRARPGVDGVMLQRVGRRGKPFQVNSLVDVPLHSGAFALYQQYTSLVGGAAVQVTWAGAQLLGAGVQFYVTAVEPVRIKRIVRGHGGLNGVSYALLECTWTLQPVASA